MIKKKYFVLLLILLIFNIDLFCQMTGSYTIGGTSPDYTTITDAVSDLSVSGVSGPGIFNIRTGTYP